MKAQYKLKGALWSFSVVSESISKPTLASVALC